MERFSVKVEKLMTEGKDREEWKQLCTDLWKGRIRVIVRNGRFYGYSVEEDRDAKY